MEPKHNGGDRKIVRHGRVQTSELEQSPATIDDELRELEQADDIDPFSTDAEIGHVPYLIELGRSSELQQRYATESTPLDPEKVCLDFFCTLYRRRSGITGIRQCVAARLKQCQILLLEQDVSGPATAKELATGIASPYEWLRAVDISKLTASKRLLFELADQLAQFDNLLCLLDPASQSADGTPPDLAACIGGALAFGLALGHTAASILHHEALERDAKTQLKRAAGQVSWEDQNEANRRRARKVISRVLQSVLLDGESWDHAYGNVIKDKVVGRDEKNWEDKDWPSRDTIRRMVENNSAKLVAEIESAERERRFSDQEALYSSVAKAWNGMGFELTPGLLGKLYDAYRHGKLLGINRLWVDKIAYGKGSQEFHRQCNADCQSALLELGNVVDAAIETSRTAK